MLAGKFTQTQQVCSAQRLKMAQHQRAGGVAASQFNLRAGFLGIHGPDQCPQGHQQVADKGGQHGAALHIGDITAFTLMKANQYSRFFPHKAHRQTGPVAVGPSRPLDRAQHHVRLDFA